jgi:hypothetical protein
MYQTTTVESSATTEQSANTNANTQAPEWVTCEYRHLRRAYADLSESRLKQVATRLRNTYQRKRLEGKATEQTEAFIEETLRIATDQFNARKTKEDENFRPLNISEYRPKNLHKTKFVQAQKWAERTSHWERVTGEILNKTTVGEKIARELERLHGLTEKPERLRYLLKRRAQALKENSEQKDYLIDWGNWIASCQAQTYKLARWPYGRSRFEMQTTYNEEA